MTPFKSEDELVREVAKAVSEGSAMLIGIDGKDGSGKTTLAKHVANEIGALVLSLDDYVERNKGGYVPHLNVEAIKSTLELEAGSIVLEGVCLLAAVERIGIALDKLIYVKRISTYGTWRDEDECAPKEPVEKVFAKMEEELRAKLPELDKEVIQYHLEFKPQDRAHYVFHRIET